MQLNVTSKTENVFLKRIEVKGIATFEKQTPSNNEVAQAVAKAVGTEAKNVVVKQIKTEFGTTKAHVSALAYKDETSKNSTEATTHHTKKIAEEAKKAKEAQ